MEVYPDVPYFLSVELVTLEPVLPTTPDFDDEVDFDEELFDDEDDLDEEELLEDAAFCAARIAVAMVPSVLIALAIKKIPRFF